jgi:hypothetical protein
MSGLEGQPGVREKKFSVVQVAQGTSSAVLAAAIVGTASGMGWLVMSLPSRLQQLESQITQILKNQDTYGEKFQKLEEKVDQHDRRLIKLEIKQ